MNSLKESSFFRILLKEGREEGEKRARSPVSSEALVSPGTVSPGTDLGETRVAVGVD